MKNVRFLTDDNGNNSSMRLLLLATIIMAGLLVLAVCAYIILSVLKEGSTVDWSGLGVFIVSLAIFVTGIVYGKVKQKEKELMGNKTGLGSSWGKRKSK